MLLVCIMCHLLFVFMEGRGGGVTNAGSTVPKSTKQNIESENTEIGQLPKTSARIL